MITCSDGTGKIYKEGIDYIVSDSGTQIINQSITKITCTKEPPKPNREQRRHPQKAVRI